jgi:hypothetical protein
MGSCTDVLHNSAAVCTRNTVQPLPVSDDQPLRVVLEVTTSTDCPSMPDHACTRSGHPTGGWCTKGSEQHQWFCCACHMHATSHTPTPYNHMCLPTMWQGGNPAQTAVQQLLNTVLHLVLAM